jgi:hypothetical protein
MKRYYKNESQFTIGNEQQPQVNRVEHSIEAEKLSISGRSSPAHGRK